MFGLGYDVLVLLWFTVVVLVFFGCWVYLRGFWFILVVVVLFSSLGLVSICLWYPNSNQPAFVKMNFLLHYYSGLPDGAFGYDYGVLVILEL